MDKNLFIGREYEIRQLEKYRDSKESEFIIVYGRRRVGKTFLIKEFFDDKYDFKVTGLYKKPKKMQLKNFHLALQEYGASTKKMPEDWLEAFAELKKLLKGIKEDRKKIIFIDELPWLDTRQSEFLAAFEAFWNGWGAQQKRPDADCLRLGHHMDYQQTAFRQRRPVQPSGTTAVSDAFHASRNREILGIKRHSLEPL